MSQSNQTKNNARISDISTFIKAGINPKTGLPIKMGSLDDCGRKNDIRIALRIMDEQDAIRRFNWYNLPNGLTGELIERILYYQGQAAFFYLEATDEFYFLPYALSGTIDVYGRYNTITLGLWASRRRLSRRCPRLSISTTSSMAVFFSMTTRSNVRRKSSHVKWSTILSST